MKRQIIATVLTCLLILSAFYGVYYAMKGEDELAAVKVGFLYENDESTPYTYNFSLAEDKLRKIYQDRVEILTRSNVQDSEMEEQLRDLLRKGCRIVFTDSYSDHFLAVASDYPDVDFCQASYFDQTDQVLPDNYHTFKGEVYQARYASGVAAGMKIRQMLENHVITEDQAIVGYICAFPTSEVISGYTAFLLGVRSIVPEATMKVKYTDVWSNFSREKEYAKQLIDEGAVVLSQHTDTIGPAIACEEASKEVWFVGYNQSMMDIAPNRTLISVRINWVPYITDAVEAIFQNKDIEKFIGGKVHGNDISAGFERDWIQLLELNKLVAAPGTQEKLDETIRAFERGTITVFQGPYIGVNPTDQTDTCDLSNGYQENKTSSFPTFHYVLKDIIEEE